MQILTGMYDYAARGVQSVARAAVELRRDPDGFQKVLQTIFNSLLLVNQCRGGQLLPKFTATCMRTAGNHNFLGFLKLPHSWIYNIHADTIDHEELAKKLDTIIQQLPPDGEVRPPITHRIIVQSTLEHMIKNDIAYRKEEDFTALLEQEFQNQYPGRKLVDLQIPRVSPSLLNTISKVLFSIVDILCVPFYLQEMQLSLANFARSTMDYVGLGAQAQSLGQTKVFQWVGRQDLGDWLSGLCAVSYASQALEALRQLVKENLTENQKKRNLWSLAASTTEVVSNTAMFLRCNEAAVFALTIIAKSMGALTILYKPKPEILGKPM